MHIYIAQQWPNLGFRIDETEYKFEHGRMEIDDEDDAILQEFLNSKKGAALAAKIRKVDYEAAAEEVKKYVDINQGRAVVGSMTTQHMEEMRRVKLQASAQMAHLTTPEEIAKFSDDLAHHDMALQETVKLPESKPAPAAITEPVEAKSSAFSLSSKDG